MLLLSLLLAVGCAAQSNYRVPRRDLERNVILEVLDVHWDRFGYCTEESLLRDPTLSGDVVMVFNVGEKGRITAFWMRKDKTNSDWLFQCLRAALSSLRFPEGRGITTRVNFTMNIPKPDRTKSLADRYAHCSEASD